MDPNQTLRIGRDAVRHWEKAARGSDREFEAAEAATGALAALDGWMLKGEPLPDDWQASRGGPALAPPSVWVLRWSDRHNSNETSVHVSEAAAMAALASVARQDDNVPFELEDDLAVEAWRGDETNLDRDWDLADYPVEGVTAIPPVETAARAATAAAARAALASFDAAVDGGSADAEIEAAYVMAGVIRSVFAENDGLPYTAPAEHPVERPAYPGAARMFNRRHSSGDMDGLRELEGVTEPVAVVVRPDGSLDVYGDIGIVDQRATRHIEADQSQDHYVTKTGRVLTDSDIEALADEAEVGYDVTNSPALTPEERRTIHARLNPNPNLHLNIGGSGYKDKPRP